MTTLFDGELEVTYGYLFLRPAAIEPVPWQASAGQVNGLCGAAQPGILSLRTGLHTGPVPLVVEVLEAEPSVDAEWEDIVEVSFSTSVTDLHLQAFDDWADLPSVPAAGTYRARYSARGMDAADDAVRFATDPPIDHYLLQLWPATEAPDAIVRQSSAVAAYWHQQARATPPPLGPEIVDAAEDPEAKRRRLQRAALLTAKLEWEQQNL